MLCRIISVGDVAQDGKRNASHSPRELLDDMAPGLIVAAERSLDELRNVLGAVGGLHQTARLLSLVGNAAAGRKNLLPN